MSLLLDALKRAEQEKSAREGATPPPAAPPLRAVPPHPGLELQPIGGGPSTAGISMQRAGDPHGAQAMFEAKSPRRGQDARGKGPLLAAIGAIAVIVLAAGAYVWFSIQSLAPRAPMAAAPLRPPAAPTPPPASGAPPSAASPSPVFSSPPAAILTAPASSANAPVAAAPDTRGSATAEAAQNRALDLLRPPQARPAAEPAPEPAPEPPVQLARTPERLPAVAPNVAGGYDALRRGDIPEARARYEAAVAADPSSVDANLGLATVEARAGRATAAAGFYRKVLKLDPRNATALAGLAALSDFTRPDDLETQLRADIAKYPNSAPLHATLGNLYAAQKRWTEAQSEYFEAHRLQPSSADTLYNLAVSLDHLGQARLAQEYYARSLDASRGQATQFDPDRVSRRLAEMQR